MPIHHAFETLIALHIITGAPGLICFWLPVVARKGGRLHRISGRLFVILMLATASLAAMMATMTLAFPTATHPHLQMHRVFKDEDMIRGIFGWMMLYLAALTLNLAIYGQACIANRMKHARNRSAPHLASQIILMVASINCAVQGLVLGQLMMMGMSTIGLATVATNLWFMLRSNPSQTEWLTEHIKALVGTGISVYTAFFAFGAVRLMPELALSPLLWSLPLAVGLGLIFYHQRAVTAHIRSSRSRARN